MEASNPYAPPSAPVRDIPQPGASMELAGRGTRLGATFLDGLVSTLLTYVPFLFVVDFTQLIGSDGQLNYAPLLQPAVALSVVPGALLFLGITTWLVIRNSQTIGKKLLGIKVVRTNGDRAGLGRIFWLRNVVLALISLIPLVGGVVVLIGYLLIFRESRKCLHDQIADTIVIKA